MKTLKVFKYIGFGILGIAFVFLAIYVTMSLWNWLIPSLFHGPVLTFWQTAGLFLLSKILLTGVAPGGHSHRASRHWRHRYDEKYRGCCGEKRDEGQVTKDE
jgi:hypothetical protein